MCKRRRGVQLVGIWLAIVAGILFAHAADAQARPKKGRIHFVAPGGSDANPGTNALPFRTLARGVRVLTPGDTLYIKSGTYEEALIHSIPPGTSWNSPVTVAAAPDQTVILKPNRGAEFVLRFQGPQQYIVIDGLSLDGAHVTHDTVKITEGANHIRLIRSEVKHAPRQGILVTSSSSNFNEFVNLNVHDNGTTKLDHGLYISTSHNVVEGSTIHRNAGYGVHVYEIDPAHGRARNNIVRNNRIFENGFGAGCTDGCAGIILGSGEGNTAHNNLVWGNTGGIKVGYLNPSNTAVYNNTLYGNSTYGIYVERDSLNAVIRNNVLYANGLPEVRNYGAGTILDHNLVGIDPKFVNAAAADFRLQPGSPAIDTGIAVSSVTTDITGTPRPQGRGNDIGALEFTDPSPH